MNARHDLKWSGLALIASLWGCMEAPPKPLEAPKLISKMPTEALGQKEAIELRFSEAVGPDDFEVRDSQGKKVGMIAESEENGQVWRLSPIGVWPKNTALDLEVKDSLKTRDGRRFEGLRWRFWSRPPILQPMIWLRWPSTSSPAPSNLAWVEVEAVGGMEPTGLISEDGQTVQPSVIKREGNLFRMHFVPKGACQPWCIGHRYSVLANGVTAFNPKEAFVIDTKADIEAPKMSAPWLQFDGHRLVISINTTEVTRLVVDMQLTRNGPVTRLESPRLSSFHMITTDPLPPKTGLWLKIQAFDLANNPSPMRPKNIRVPPNLRFRIQEVVTTPQHDWNDSKAPQGSSTDEEGVATGVPLDGIPGTGAITARDSWIEIVNLSDSYIDLDQLRLWVEAIDSSPAKTLLATAPSRYFGWGGNNVYWRPGEALVVNLNGSMSKKGLKLRVTSAGEVFDEVEIGDSATADHPGGHPPDFDHESIAIDRTGNFRWCRPTPGDAVPNPDCL